MPVFCHHSRVASSPSQRAPPKLNSLPSACRNVTLRTPLARAARPGARVAARYRRIGGPQAPIPLLLRRRRNHTAARRMAAGTSRASGVVGDRKACEQIDGHLRGLSGRCAVGIATVALCGELPVGLDSTGVRNRSGLEKPGRRRMSDRTDVWDSSRGQPGMRSWSSGT